MSNLKPEVGMGATMGVGSDSYAYTIIEVAANGKSFQMTRDITKLISGDAMSETQEYSYTFDLNGQKKCVKLGRDGEYRTLGGKKWGSRISLGHRRYYQDPCF